MKKHNYQNGKTIKCVTQGIMGMSLHYLNYKVICYIFYVQKQCQIVIIFSWDHSALKEINID